MRPPSDMRRCQRGRPGAAARQARGRPWGEARLRLVKEQGARRAPARRAPKRSDSSQAAPHGAPERRQSPALAAVFSSRTACAAARRANGTRYGEQLT